MTVTKTNSNTYNLKVYIPKEIRPKMGLKEITLLNAIKQERRPKKLN